MKADFLRTFESIVFPFHSILTSLPTEGMDLDWREVEHLTQLDQACPICARQSIQCRVCGQCLVHPPSFEVSKIAFPYLAPIKQLILDYKFYDQLFLSRLLATLWWQQAQRQNWSLEGVEALVPVPLHVNRLRERGFNQSLELAKVLSSLSGIPVQSHWVERVADTPHQIGLGSEQRRQNLKNAFALTPECDFSGVKRVALIDDVVTTGTTLEALAALLKQQSTVAQVEVWAIARAV